MVFLNGISKVFKKFGNKKKRTVRELNIIYLDEKQKIVKLIKFVKLLNRVATKNFKLN